LKPKGRKFYWKIRNAVFVIKKAGSQKPALCFIITQSNNPRERLGMEFKDYSKFTEENK